MATAGLDDEIRAALAEIEREWLKAAAIGAAVDAALAIVAVTAVLTVASTTAFSTPLVGPVTAGAALAIAAGVAVAGAELAWQLRRSTVERFEAANPAVREALRTARDAVADGRDGPVATAHYRTVIDRLGEASSRDLLPLRRLTVTLAVVGLLAAATFLAPASGLGAVASPAVGGGDAGPEPEDDPGAGDDGGYDGLREGDEILGHEDDLSAGDLNVSVPVDSLPGGPDEGESDEGGENAYPGSEAEIEPQSTGYDEPTPVEDADLVREYTLAIQAAERADAEGAEGAEGTETEADDNE